MTVPRWLGALLLAAVLAVQPAAAAVASGSERGADQPGTVNVQVVPPLAGVAVTVDGTTAVSDAAGTARVPVDRFSDLTEQSLTVAPVRLGDREVMLDRIRGELSRAWTGQPIAVGLRTRRLVSVDVTREDGSAFPMDRIQDVRLKSSMGEKLTLTSTEASEGFWVAEMRTVQVPDGVQVKEISWAVEEATLNGTSAVNRSQQRFVPARTTAWTVKLLLYDLHVQGRDLLLPTAAGTGVAVTWPDGSVAQVPFDASGRAVLRDLPRGTYEVVTTGGAVDLSRPVSISRDLDEELAVITPLDLAVVGTAGLSLAVALILIGRPYLLAGAVAGLAAVGSRLLAVARRRPRPVRDPVVPHIRRPLSAVAALVLLTGASCMGLRAEAAALPTADRPAPSPLEELDAVPVLAHYYIWFDPSSWKRVKKDYPLLGQYDSDDPEVMRQHVRMAKDAGIDGFLVSWKHLPALDDRLETLVEVARANDFKLGIVYQGLDFSRNPLPAETVRDDLRYFLATWGDDPVFDIFGRPVVIWTGDYRTPVEGHELVRREVGDRLLLLSAARSLEEYEPFADLTDGLAYYWSSADPVKSRIDGKLRAMSKAVDERGGLWIAPAAPGYDARLLGGDRVVPRRDGETLRESLAAAIRSEPDAIGLISWNEFSENTHVEPSENYGHTALDELAAVQGFRRQLEAPADSDAEVGRGDGALVNGASLGLLVLGGGALLLIAGARTRRALHAQPTPIRKDD